MADGRIFRALRALLGEEGTIPKNVNLTTVGNVGAGEDDLITYTLPANALSKNAKGVRITAWGKKANNATAKTVKLHFGSADLGGLALATSEAGAWKIEAVIMRTAEDVQKGSLAIYDGPTDGSLVADIATTQDDGAAIVIKCTGTAGADDDIQQEGLIVEVIGA